MRLSLSLSRWRAVLSALLCCAVLRWSDPPLCECFALLQIARQIQQTTLHLAATAGSGRAAPIHQGESGGGEGEREQGRAERRLRKLTLRD